MMVKFSSQIALIKHVSYKMAFVSLGRLFLISRNTLLRAARLSSVERGIYERGDFHLLDTFSVVGNSELFFFCLFPIHPLRDCLNYYKKEQK